MKERLLVWCLILCTGIFLEKAFREVLYDQGVSIILRAQEFINNHQSRYEIISILKFISFFGTKEALTLIAYAAFAFSYVYKAYLLMLVIGTIPMQTAVLKLIIKESRPYFHVDSVQVYDCEMGYGNPSGHSIAAASVYLSLYRIYVLLTNEHLRAVKSEEGSKCSPLAQSILKLFTYIFIFSVFFSRLALGTHTLNQVFLGGFIGYMVYTFFFDVLLLKAKASIDIPILLSKSVKLLFIGIYAGLNLLGVLIFHYSPDANPEKEKYKRAILEKCGQCSYSKILEYESLLFLACSSYFIGIYSGLYRSIFTDYKGNVDKWLEFNEGSVNNKAWNETGVFRSWVRYLFCLVAFALVMLPLILISSRSNFLFLYFCGYQLPFLFSGYLTTKHLAQLCYKMGLGASINIRKNE